VFQRALDVFKVCATLLHFGSLRCSHGRVRDAGISGWQQRVVNPTPPSLSLSTWWQVFLVDVISLTRANCAQPMNYFSSLLVLLLGLKLLLVLVHPRVRQP
jgi:hypothetical protein